MHRDPLSNYLIKSANKFPSQSCVKNQIALFPPRVNTTSISSTIPKLFILLYRHPQVTFFKTIIFFMVVSLGFSYGNICFPYPLNGEVCERKWCSGNWPFHQPSPRLDFVLLLKHAERNHSLRRTQRHFALPAKTPIRQYCCCNNDRLKRVNFFVAEVKSEQLFRSPSLRTTSFYISMFRSI